MAGITTPAFRRGVRRWGAALAFTEMVSACGIEYRNQRTLRYLDCDAGDHPLGVQLFGADPDAVGRAASESVAAGADLIDLNMACPVRKVVKTGAGAALLADAGRAVAMVAAVRAAVGPSLPVTVKVRAGLREGDELGRRLAPLLVAAGADAICIHPRSAAQLYHGRADHGITVALAAELPVPVIASGDMDGHAAAQALLEGGAAAVMLARHAVGRPWLFREVLGGAAPPPVEDRRRELQRFVADALADDGPRAVGYLRQFWQRYRRSGALTRECAQQLMEAPDEASVRALLAL